MDYSGKKVNRPHDYRGLALGAVQYKPLDEMLLWHLKLIHYTFYLSHFITRLKILDRSELFIKRAK